MSQQRCQTWAERVEDTEKVPLDGAFIETLMLTAYANERDVEDVWIMWRSYVETCESRDQSPVFREFCQWRKLTGAGPLA